MAAFQQVIKVTSLAEVWIEIISGNLSDIQQKVTSLAEVWIEIPVDTHSAPQDQVTSLAEVWIEICGVALDRRGGDSHFPCGSVD